MGCVIVTGASRGIGNAIAHKMAQRGHNLVLVYQNPSTDSAALVQEIEAIGVRAIALCADVSDFDAAKRIVDEAVAAFGTIDALINNAGITRDRLMLRMSSEDFEQVLRVNTLGTFHCTRHAARVMMKQKHGSIINLSSVVSLTGNIGQANYSASKAAVNAFTKTAALELAPYQIRVNAVLPGFIQTDMTDQIPEKEREAMLARIPLGRPGASEDVADLVDFLVSDQSRYITGQAISVNGGMV